LSKEDLWEALQEYPEARRTLIEKGRQLLRKDNLLDEEVAKRQDMEQSSVEQKVDALESIFENVSIRLDQVPRRTGRRGQTQRATVKDFEIVEDVDLSLKTLVLVPVF